MSAKLAPLTDHTLDIAYNFEVRVAEGGEVGNFLSIEGLERSIEPYEHVEGGRNHTVHSLVGQAKYGELSLRWGWMKLNWLHDWAMQVEVGRSFRKDLLITQLTHAFSPLRVYTVIGAWPISWTGAKLDSSSSEVPIEEVKLRFWDLKLDIKDPKRRSVR